MQAVSLLIILHASHCIKERNISATEICLVSYAVQRMRMDLQCLLAWIPTGLMRHFIMHVPAGLPKMLRVSPTRLAIFIQPVSIARIMKIIFRQFLRRSLKCTSPKDLQIIAGVAWDVNLFAIVNIAVTVFRKKRETIFHWKKTGTTKCINNG